MNTGTRQLWWNYFFLNTKIQRNNSHGNSSQKLNLLQNSLFKITQTSSFEYWSANSKLHFAFAGLGKASPEKWADTSLLQCCIKICFFHTSLLSLLCGRGGFCRSKSKLSLGDGRVHPGQVASSSQGPYWWQRPPCKVSTAHQEQFGVQHLAQGHIDMQFSWELGFEPATFQSLDNLLYLLSYSRPSNLLLCRSNSLSAALYGWSKSLL